MNNIKDFVQYINEVKSERELVRDLARRLSFDKDVIKYLNTSRAKRPMGWRELLQTKLHGNNLNYINYITKNMVSDYNPQITGYININDEDGDFDEETEKENDEITKKELKTSLDGVIKRVEDIEDVLGIDPGDEETVEIAKEKLGLNTDDEEEETEETEEE